MAWHGVTADDLNVVGEEGRRFKKSRSRRKITENKKRTQTSKKNMPLSD